MEYTALGSTGTSVPLLGIGTSSETNNIELLRSAADAGASFVDTAETYGSEEVIGRAATGMRDRFFIATKVWKTHLGRTDLVRAADESLKRLGTDYIDLYQVHWPNARVPIEETMGAMEDLVDSGRIRYIGVSNFSYDRMRQAAAVLRSHPLVSNQLEYSLIDRHIEADLLQACRELDVTVIAYRPLGLGLRRLAQRDHDRALDEVATRLGRSPAQVALNWCIGGGGVVAIPRTSSIDHLHDNCAAAGWRLSEDDRRLLERSIRPRRHPGLWERGLRDQLRGVLRRSATGRVLLGRILKRRRSGA